MPRGRKNTIDDVWNKVDVRGHDKCWPWLGSRTPKGYGHFRMDGKLLRAHRVALSTVRDIPNGMHVLHSCDNPPCCNPDHLFVGTNADNMRDKVQKGRHPRGELQRLSKLTESQVRFIKETDITPKKISKIFGVSEPTISQIKSGKRWGHVP